MNRSSFIKQIASTVALISLSDFLKTAKIAAANGAEMPVMFAGHGSPMNAIEKNIFSNTWASTAASLPRPAAILVISAHWLTKGTYVTTVEKPETIHDFGGFPKELFDVQYPAPGNPDLAADIMAHSKTYPIMPDSAWGLDHGTWSILGNMYPAADIPVLQLSIDVTQPAIYHFQLARELSYLRKKGVLIMGSGNMIHNLGMVDWKRLNEINYGFDWAVEINEILKQKITGGNYAELVNWEKLHKHIHLAIPSIDHYFPAIYALGLAGKDENVSFFNDNLVAGSLNMTSFLFSGKN